MRARKGFFWKMGFFWKIEIQKTQMIAGALVNRFVMGTLTDNL